ncbi:MAG: hypothetical protein AAF292_00150 [Pseudomonadota bacterium]
MASNPLDPLGFQKAMLAVMADSTRTVQTQWVQAISSFAAKMPDTVTWKTVDVPVVNAKFVLDEEQMREAFQIAADLNLNAWTQAATILSAMPNWATWHAKVPGRIVTDMFHAMQTGQSAKDAA